MMRYINMDNQVNSDERRFAFWDTVRDQFVSIQGEQSWCSVAKLDQSFDDALYDYDTKIDDVPHHEALRERLIGLARASGAQEVEPPDDDNRERLGR